VKQPVWVVDRRRAALGLVLSFVAMVTSAVGVVAWRRNARPLLAVEAAFAVPSKPAWLALLRTIGDHRCHGLHPGDGIVVHAAADRVVRLYYDGRLLMAECRPGQVSALCAFGAHGRQLRWTFSSATHRVSGYIGAARVYTWVTLPPNAPPSNGRLEKDLDHYRGHGAVPYERGDVTVRW
jgi:hypothetical protein